MSKCEWFNPGTPRKADPVFQGRSYLLLSGLLEISYDVGAKVIVEGPAVYRVDALNGGSLVAGKVTIHAVKFDRTAGKAAGNVKRAVPGQGTGSRDLTPPPTAAAFCVVTSSAVVKNRGDHEAQFGVEVDQAGATYMRVLSGVVTVRSAGFQTQIVPPGMCVYTGAGANHDELLVYRPGPLSANHPSSIFVTEMPKPPVYAAKPGLDERGRGAGRGG